MISNLFALRRFSSKLPIVPYFAPTDSIAAINRKFAALESLADLKEEVRAGGRIIGRRKASSSLLFLDLESNGSSIQVMLDAKTLQQSDFKLVADACQRGAVVGITGFPTRTQAGEFTISATGFSHLAECPQNLPMMNWSHKKTLKDSEKRF